jgi:tryptophan-rich sensory protein
MEWDVMKQLLRYLWLVVFALVGFSAITEFDQADTLIELLRGLFWMSIAVASYWMWLDEGKSK